MVKYAPSIEGKRISSNLWNRLIHRVVRSACSVSQDLCAVRQVVRHRGGSIPAEGAVCLSLRKAVEKEK